MNGSLASGAEVKLEDEDEDDEDEGGLYLSDEEVDELIEDAAGFLCVLDELRPLEPSDYNAFYEVWTRIARIPAEERYRLLDELEPGCLRALWKASMGRYVLDPGRSLELFGEGAGLWEDFPLQPGQVVEYAGRCERYEFDPRGVRLEVDAASTARAAGLGGGPPGRAATPWLRPSLSALEMPVSSFTQYFFAVQQQLEPGGSGQQAGALVPPRLYSRVVLPFVGPLERWWEPLYCRLRVELTLTPLASDAGADLLLLYPADPACQPDERPGVLEPDERDDERGWDLAGRADLPSALWPAPEPSAHPLSPFSSSPRDYLRMAGPGVYVGCAYREGPAPGELREENCVYFALVRRWRGGGRGDGDE